MELWLTNMAMGTTDILVLAVLLTGPAVIGSICAVKQPSQSVRDFLVGSRALKVLPAALSLIARYGQYSLLTR